ncbi:MAG: hypothetical protein NTU41_00575, partial [Chloroflexi bacterium]|nr:hypothetical protein [Chloroflexota bacterium]
DGNPNDALRGLARAEGEGREALLGEISLAAYRPILGNVDLAHATLGQVQECFRKCGADNNVGHKCLSFFLALAKDAGIALSPSLLGRSRVGAVQKTSTPVFSTRKRRVAPGQSGRQPSRTGITESDSLVGKLPEFDPNWPKDVRDDWFESLHKLMMLMHKFPSFDAQWSDELKMKWFDSLRAIMGRGAIPPAVP